MGERVVGVGVLVEDVGVGDLLLQTARDADVALGRVPGGLVGVRMMVAPRALRTETFSADIFSGRVMMVL